MLTDLYEYDMNDTERNSEKGRILDMPVGRSLSLMILRNNKNVLEIDRQA